MDSVDTTPTARPADPWWLARSVLIVVVCALTGLLAVLLATAAKNPQLEINWPKDVDPVVTVLEVVLAMRDGQDFPWWLVVALTLLIVASTIGIAAFVRDWRRAHRAEREAAAARGEVGQLSERLLRQQEREEVAREVHDALGHRLSLLNLHASALEMQAAGNEPLARSARVVQENAQQSAADLRALLAVLRDPQTPELHDGLPGLADVPQLLEETRLAGTPITASFFVDDSSPLDPEFSRDCYRIVQELLTNAREHAPGQQLRIHIDVTPRHGADITAVNQLSPEATDEFTEGNGLLGIRERARRTGCDAAAGIEHIVSTGSGDTAVFRTTVHLPWRDAKAP